MLFTDEQLAAILVQTELFEDLHDEDARVFAPLFQVRRSERADLIIEEGTTGNALYVVLSGEVEVVKDVVDGPPHVLATLEGGACFGEMAIIDGASRMASVRAVQDTVLAVLPREAFSQLIEENHPSATRLLRAMAGILCQRQRQLTYILQDLVESGGSSEYDRPALLRILRRYMTQN